LTMKEEVITGKDGNAVLPNGATAIGALIGSVENCLLLRFAKKYFLETNLLFNTQLFIRNGYNN